jgi:hypothetical protein
LPDLSGAPFAILVSMMIILVWLGWYPTALFSATEPALQFFHYIEPSMPNAAPLQPNGDPPILIFQPVPHLLQASAR